MKYGFLSFFLFCFTHTYILIVSYIFFKWNPKLVMKLVMNKGLAPVCGQMKMNDE